MNERALDDIVTELRNINYNLREQNRLISELTKEIRNKKKD
jgi:hypothetical protein